MEKPFVRFGMAGLDCGRTEKFFRDVFQRPGTAGCTAAGEGWPRGVAIYVKVDDVAAYLAKAESLGGQTLVPPVQVPGGTFAWFADAGGITVVLWKPDEWGVAADGIGHHTLTGGETSTLT